MAKDKEIRIRCTSDLKKDLEKMAKYNNSNVSKLLYKIIQKELDSMDNLNGTRWGDLSTEQKSRLLLCANPIDGRTGNNMEENGECIIDFSNGLSIIGSVIDGEIIIQDNATFYNPEN